MPHSQYPSDHAQVGMQVNSGADGVEVVQPPSIVTRKLGPGAVLPMRLDPRVLQRMERAIEKMADSYEKSLKTEIRQMLLSHDEWQAGKQEAIHAIYALAHDIRGLAGTFSRPVTGRISNALCQYLEAMPHLDAADGAVVRLHVDAMFAAAMDAQEPSEEVAKATLAGLERLVGRTLEHCRPACDPARG